MISEMRENQVGKRIRKLRAGLKLSRAQFGKLIGVSGQYVGQIERDSHSLTVVVMAKICRIARVSSDYIVFGNICSADVAAALEGYSNEQIQIILEIAMRTAQFLSTKNGNNLLIKEVFHRCHSISCRQ